MTSISMNTCFNILNWIPHPLHFFFSKISTCLLYNPSLDQTLWLDITWPVWCTGSNETTHLFCYGRYVLTWTNRVAYSHSNKHNAYMARKDALWYCVHLLHVSLDKVSNTFASGYLVVESFKWKESATWVSFKDKRYICIIP